MSAKVDTASTVVLADEARKSQLAIRARLLVEVAKLWPLLDKRHLAASFPGWLQAMRLVTLHYHAESSSAAGTSYLKAREHFTQSPAPTSLVKLAPAPEDDWLEKAYRFAGPGLIDKDTARPNTALSTTLGTAARIAQHGGRTTTLDTIAADPVALGWHRVTDGQPCAFCALLASRGNVYKADSFDRSDARFHGVGEFKVHNDCGCSIAPVFTRDQALPDTSTQALDVYRNRGNGPALPAFRKAWAAHLAAVDAP